MADKLISQGANSLEKSGVNYLDQKIDASGRGYGGVRYMSPAGGGLRLAGHGTQVGTGLRLAGSGYMTVVFGFWYLVFGLSVFDEDV
jgi:hypothetical protein